MDCLHLALSCLHLELSVFVKIVPHFSVVSFCDWEEIVIMPCVIRVKTELQKLFYLMDHSRSESNSFMSLLTCFVQLPRLSSSVVKSMGRHLCQNQKLSFPPLFQVVFILYH